MSLPSWFKRKPPAPPIDAIRAASTRMPDERLGVGDTITFGRTVMYVAEFPDGLTPSVRFEHYERKPGR